MASIRSYVHGAGGTTGAALATLKRTQLSGNYYYLGNSVSGASDANPGLERTKPLATLAQAYANASAYDTIVALSGHNETIGTLVTFGKAGLSLVGEGSGSTLPKFTNGVGVATNPMIKVTAGSVMFDSIYFPTSSVNARERIDIEGGGGVTIINNCYFECGINDAQRTIYYTSVGPDVMNGCTFVVVSAGCGPGIQMAGVSNAFLADNVVFDGGSFGWTLGYAFQGDNDMNSMRMTRVYQLNGSHILLATGTTGTLQIEQATGDSRVDWTP